MCSMIIFTRKCVLTCLSIIITILVVVVPTAVILAGKKRSANDSNQKTDPIESTTVSTAVSNTQSLNNSLSSASSIFTSITSTRTSTTAARCMPACGTEKLCLNDLCVSTGNLAISATWSRMGSCDLVVRTPNNNDISSVFYRGVTSETDFGELERNLNVYSTGPQNIFWALDLVPPSGTYHVCFETAYCSIDIDANEPLIATIYIRKPFIATEIYTRTFTNQTRGLYYCTNTSDSFIVSISYP